MSLDIYLVGGAVRDQLLGLTVQERDYVVVGSTETEMLNLGYRPVGADFPVFLHPETSEEYALARTERKTAPGHQGFVCHSDPSVTLEEDLLRRDLTINAIAMDQDGKLIDPYHGRQDIEDKLIRHVSDAFTEDPLRILRVARFLARFAHLGFKVHSNTADLLKEMVNAGLHRELTTERVLLELDKALTTDTPSVFFTYLDSIGAGPDLWPELGQKDFERLGTSRARSTQARFAELTLELSGLQIKAFCQRLKTSRDRQELATLVAANLAEWERFGNNPNTSDAEAIADFIRRADGLRKSERFSIFNDICQEITGKAYAKRWQTFGHAMDSVRAKELSTDATGPALGELIQDMQVIRVKELL